MLKKSDEELMLAYQLGDENAFRELYARHSERVFGFLRWKTGNEAKARDIFQGTFLKLHNSRDRYNSSLPFVPWLFTICRSELLDAVKKERRLKEELTPEFSDLTTPVVAEGLDISTLDSKQQAAVSLRFFQSSSFEEIAEALETSPANARQIVSRAIKTLRSLYAKE